MLTGHSSGCIAWQPGNENWRNEDKGKAERTAESTGFAEETKGLERTVEHYT
jgi:hypothetical protein